GSPKWKAAEYTNVPQDQGNHARAPPQASPAGAGQKDRTADMHSFTFVRSFFMFPHRYTRFLCRFCIESMSKLKTFFQWGFFLNGGGVSHSGEMFLPVTLRASPARTRVFSGGYPPPNPGVHFWPPKSEPKNRQNQGFGFLFLIGLYQI